MPALRLPFRLTPLSAIELSFALLFSLVGLILILGTTDEYKAGRAFNAAMDNYAAGVLEDVYHDLERAMEAKPDYAAPREAYAKLMVDEGYKNPAKFTEAIGICQDLQRRQEAAGKPPSLPVLVTLAVASLEAVRAQSPTPQALAAAMKEARRRLESALDIHADSGDVHVNLATLALMENDLPRCKAEMEKVIAVGNISPDALPVFYNLSGLVALREKLFVSAASEFEKVKEFRPDWDVPQLNLGAAYAQVLLTPKADPYLVDRSANALRRVLPGLRKSQSPLCGLIYEALALYYLQTRRPRTQPSEALQAYGEAERYGKLTWQSRFNRAIARFLELRYASRRVAPALYAGPAGEITPFLTDPKASPRDKLMASCILGSIEVERDKPKEAIAHFERALSLAEQASPPIGQAILSRICLSLGSLYYEAGRLPEAFKLFEKGKDTPDPEERKQLDRFFKENRSAPSITQFEVKREVLFTAHDLQVSALLATPGSPVPLGPENVALSLTEELSGLTKPLPFQLNGPALYAVALNLPQGRYRVKLTLTDPFGGRDEAASEPLEIDREAPQVLARVPDAGATVNTLKAIEFKVEDSLSPVDLAALRVMLRYPPGTPLSRTLVAGGKYQFPSPDGKIARNTPATTDVKAPVPADKLPNGEYRVTVHVQDSKGNARDVEWTFRLAQ